MKNNNKVIFNIHRFVAVITVLAIMVGCRENAWEDHYEQLDSRQNSNILKVLSDDPEFSDFVALLKQTELDLILDSSEAYTVWAPTNSALSQLSDEVRNDSESLKQLLENHISKFSYNSTFDENSILIKMLNDKFVEFSNIQGDVNFGTVDVEEEDILTSNGVVHKLTNVLEVKSNIWDYISENSNMFAEQTAFLNQFNEIGFDESNSEPIEINSLGQTVYDSAFVETNSFFNIIGDLKLEETRFTYLALTDDVYSTVFDELKEFYQFPVEDSIKANTDQAIFRNLNFLPSVALEDLDGTDILSTTGNQVIINPADVTEEVDLSNGNVFLLNQLNLEPEKVIYKPVRYEIEDSERRTIGDLSNFIVQRDFNFFSSGNFTNEVSLLVSPNAGESNNFFEISFSNVLSASYNINLKFTPVGAQLKTKLKFEFSYLDADKNLIKNEIEAIEVETTEDGVITIGDTYDIPVFINDEIDNEYFVKLKVFVDVSDSETIIYGRRFGIDYAELTPVE